VRRLVEHNAGHAAWSRRKRPWRLIGLERFGTADAAKQRERTLKRNPRMLQQFKRRMLNRAAAGRPRQVVG
jgi:predicted GIY-YIG superfamily endonuclease